MVAKSLTSICSTSGARPLPLANLENHLRWASSVGVKGSGACSGASAAAVLGTLSHIAHCGAHWALHAFTDGTAGPGHAQSHALELVVNMPPPLPSVVGPLC